LLLLVLEKVSGKAFVVSHLRPVDVTRRRRPDGSLASLRIVMPGVVVTLIFAHD